MKGKLCIVTGANSGIGRATAVALARKGAEVVMVCRNQERGEKALEEIRSESQNSRVSLMLADLSSFDSVRNFRREFSERYDSLDVLVNNAGLYVPKRTLSADGHELTFAVNHLGTYLITVLLMPFLRASESARVVVVSSLMHRLGRKEVGRTERSFYQGMLAYADSKLANVLFTYELARRCAGTAVVANCVHPGVVRTGFGQDDPGLFHFLVKGTKLFYSSPEKGAISSIHLASSPAVDGVTGAYFVGKKRRRTSRASYCAESARLLWDLSAETTGVDF